MGTTTSTSQGFLPEHSDEHVLSDGDSPPSSGSNSYRDPADASESYESEIGSPVSLTNLVRTMAETNNKKSITQDTTNYELVPITFSWRHKGNEVFVAGGFNGWQGKMRLFPDPATGEFSLTIDVPPGEHQYKFIVDDDWRLNPDCPTVVDRTSGDGVVVNNVVHVQRPVFEDSNVPFKDSDDEDERDDRKQKTVYGRLIRPAEDYLQNPPPLPPHLTQVLLNEPPPNGDSASLPIPSHVILNHLVIHQKALSSPNESPSYAPRPKKVPPSATTGSLKTPLRDQNLPRVRLRSLSDADEAPPPLEVPEDPFADPNLYTNDVIVTAITKRFKTKAHASFTPKFVTTVYYAPRPVDMPR